MDVSWSGMVTLRAGHCVGGVVNDGCPIINHALIGDECDPRRFFTAINPIFDAGEL